MKKTLLTLILAAVTAIAMAAPVTQVATQRLASFFYHEQGGTGSLTLVEAPQYPHIHIYAVTGGNGFVMISADDVVFPILAYSTTTPLDINDMAPATAYWIGKYENQICWNIEKGHTASAQVTEEWQRLYSLNPTQLRTFSQTASTSTTYNTANLLTTTWSQGSNRYNAQCPYDSDEGERTLTGCVATAMAQIMKYWGHPLRGVGSYSYNCPPYGTQAADFSDTVFNYSIMPNKLTSNSSQQEIDAVALLMRRCGIAVEMEYGVDGSASSTIGFNSYRSAESAYNEHFKYMHSLHAIGLEDYTDSAWVAEMKNEINNGRPVHYSAGDEVEGGGHSFICCGYDNTGKLYFNWGWGGTYDGYYQIGQLNPGSDHYNDRNRAIVGIIPDTTEAATTIVTLTPSIPGAATLTGAGTYNSYTDWVTIKAMGTPGYLVDGWDDSNTYNPFTFLANGGNVNHTAICTALRGDTLGYCKDSYSTAWGSSSSMTHKWGIRLDSLSILPNRALKSIKTYFAESGAFSIELYYGTATETVGNPIKSYNVTIKSSDVDNWGTLNLPNPVPIDRSQSLWIVFSWTGQGYPKACSDFRGNTDGEWTYSTSAGEWRNYATYYSEEYLFAWMIRGIFQYNPGPYAITVDVDDATHGTATGSGTYASGATATITATANKGYKFREWNDGDKTASRTITVTDVAHYTAYFDEAPETGVSNGESEMITVYSNGSDIIIENAAGADAAIYDAAGRLIMTHSITTSRQSISLPAGTYFVQVGGKSHKAVVSK